LWISELLHVNAQCMIERNVEPVLCKI